MAVAAPDTPSSPTPILDRIISIPAVAKPPVWQRVGSALFGLTLAGFVILIASGVVPQNWVKIHVPFQPYLPPEPGRGILLVCALPVAIVFAISVHEIAHALLGVALGLKLRSLRVGPIEIKWPFRLSYVRDRTARVTGWAMLFPVETRQLDGRLALIVLAGPLANLAVGLMVVLLLRPMGVFSVTFAFTSLMTAIMELMPVRRGLQVTDGLHVVRLLSSPAHRERTLVLARLHLEQEKGVAPDALSRDLLERALATSDDSPENMGVFALASSAAYYRNDDAMTARCLEQCLKHLAYAPPRFQHALMCDAGVFQARKRKRIDLAKQWLEQIPAKAEIPWLRAEVEIAILEVTGEFQAALCKLEALEPVVRAFPDRSYSQNQNRSLLRWKSELQAQIAKDLQSTG